MASPVFTALNPNQQAPQQNQWVGVMNQIRQSPNPSMLFQKLAMQNPQIQQAMAYVNQCGGDPRAAFYQMARQKGIDPEQVLSMLR